MVENNDVHYLVERAKPDDSLLLSAIAKISKSSLGYSPEIIELWYSELIVTQEMISSFISLVVKKKDEIVGFWCREPKETFSDGRFFVLPKEQRKGCGTLLWKAMMEECRLRGLRKLEFEADYKVLPFYLKMGAQVIGKKDSDYLPGLKLPIIRVTLF